MAVKSSKKDTLGRPPPLRPEAIGTPAGVDPVNNWILKADERGGNR